MSSVARPYSLYAPALPKLDAIKTPLFTQAGTAIFILGVASGIPIQTIGRLYIGELVLMAISPVVVLLLLGLTDEYGKTARIILFSMILGWIGYVISDFVRGTPASDYMRGWSRWVAMASTFCALAWLGSKHVSYLLSFVTGLAIGGWLTPFLYGGFVGPAYFWKFHASVPACLLALVVAKHFKPWFAIGAMGFLAIVSAVLDTRSIALLCLITAGITALATMRTSRLRRAVAPISKTSIVVAGLLLLSVALGAVFFVKYFGDRYGYSKRGANSDATRLANAQVAFSAIKASPIIGYGSWPRNPELARQRDKLVAKAKGIPVNRMASQEDLIISHSQILQGWVEGGVLGFIFFVVLGWLIGKTLFWQTLIGPYSPLTPLLTFVLLECMWSLFLSPFSGGQRVYIPAACVFMCYVVEKRRQTHAGSSYLAWNSLPAS